MRHTPGTWEVRAQGESNEYVILSDGKWVLALRQNGEAIVERQKANANLIAAAPDMLKLLQDLIDIEGPQPGHAGWVHQVRMMMAKATTGTNTCYYASDGTLMTIDGKRSIFDDVDQ